MERRYRPPEQRKQQREKESGLRTDALTLLLFLRQGNGHNVTGQDTFVFLKEKPVTVLKAAQQLMLPPVSLDKPVGTPNAIGERKNTLGDLIPDSGPSIEDQTIIRVSHEEIPRFLASCGLTSKQLQVLMLLSEGMTLKETAEQIGAKDPQNVKGIRNRARKKLLQNPAFCKRFGLPDTI